MSSKTPEELAEEYGDKIKDTHSVTAACEKAFLAGYKAAQEKYEARIKELEIELDNWKHEAIHGDEGL